MQVAHATPCTAARRTPCEQPADRTDRCTSPDAPTPSDLDDRAHDVGHITQHQVALHPVLGDLDPLTTGAGTYAHLVARHRCPGGRLEQRDPSDDPPHLRLPTNGRQQTLPLWASWGSSPARPRTRTRKHARSAHTFTPTSLRHPICAPHRPRLPSGKIARAASSLAPITTPRSGPWPRARRRRVAPDPAFHESEVAIGTIKPASSSASPSALASTPGTAEAGASRRDRGAHVPAPARRAFSVVDQHADHVLFDEAVLRRHLLVGQQLTLDLMPLLSNRSFMFADSRS